MTMPKSEETELLDWPKSELINDRLFEKNEPRATFVGYPGDSTTSGRKRLYLDIEFNTYIDVEEKDILLVKPVAREILEYGGVRIWVSRYTEIIYGGTFTQKIHSKVIQEELKNNKHDVLIPGQLGIYDPVQVHDRMK